MNELIERTSRAIASCKGDAPILKAVLLDCRKEIERLTKELEAKPVGEPVAFRANVDGVWFVASTHKFMKATLEKSDVTAEIHPLYTTPPSIDALIGEINGLGKHTFPESQETFVRLKKLNAILDKWRTK